jgi:glycosyltransferase involved in cell wall biosynthesis
MSLSYSVVIPAYNATRTLSASLESVMQQSLPALEVIVVDDGSTDDTVTLARGFSSVRVVSQRNCGPGPACNAGVALAQGDVLTFLDADDLWTPGAMQAQISALCRNKAAHAVVGDMVEFVCAGETTRSAARFAPRARQAGWISGATAIRAASFRSVGLFGAVDGGHWLDWMDRARRAGLVFALSGELVLQRRLHSGSLTMTAKRGRSLLLAAREAIRRRKADERPAVVRRGRDDRVQD